MQQFLVKVVVNALAIWVAAAVVPGVVIRGDNLGETVATLLIVGALFGLINTLIKPVVVLFTLPFYVLTLGLIAFVVNALMLTLLSWLSDQLGISFNIDDFFWSALGAAVIVTFVSMVLNLVLPEND